MKIISWNVNGFRAWSKKEGTLDFINRDEQPDIFCLQETKAQPEQIDGSLFNDYPFQYFHSAEKKGYSSTAVFSKKEPLKVWYGMDNSPIENEGRIINAEFDNFILITVYTPNAKPDLARLELRHKEWDVAFLKHMKKYEKKKPVIVCGDLNAAHTPIDIARPDANKTTDTKPGSPGFTDQEREGITNFLNAGFVDTYRNIYPEKIQYTWWSYRAGARARNVGWRIDYFLSSPKIKLKDAIIYDQALGSDHCPVGIIIT
ncbi:MAG: exodeoxyribonuclease III [Candidatus Pacebacteria bacterium]|nr:exodeoxyribonuclease III [Candidatus Paceibacterota bacterium]